MAFNVPAIVRAVTARTGLPRTFVEMRARALQDAGLLPVGAGRNSPPAKPIHVARLLLALAADNLRTAPATVYQLGEMVWPFRTDTALDGIEEWISSIFSGSRTPRGHILEIDKTSPAVHLRQREGKGLSFFPLGSYMPTPLDSVRATLQIPGIVIAAIGADLGLRGCANAA